MALRSDIHAKQLYDCQSGVWAGGQSPLDAVDLTIASTNAGSATYAIGNYRFCAVSGIGGERPHGGVYRASATANAAGQYPYNAYFAGYGLTMDLRVSCIY